MKRQDVNVKIILCADHREARELFREHCLLYSPNTWTFNKSQMQATDGSSIIQWRGVTTDLWTRMQGVTAIVQWTDDAARKLRSNISGYRALEALVHEMNSRYQHI